jgi:hypothetical protein
VPHLWRDGIRESRGRIVALTNSTMVPADDWLASIERQHRSHDVVAGAIEPWSRLRLSDWAEYLCRYSPDMLPFDDHESVDLPGDNVSYKRELLERASGVYRDGFWEPAVHRWLAASGTRLWHSPELVVRQGRSGGPAAFVRQRLRHGRSRGRRQGAELSAARNLLGIVASPAVPLLLTLRIVRQAAARRRLRARVAAALPYILLFNAAWALGEAFGHLEALRSR